MNQQLLLRGAQEPAHPWIPLRAGLLSAWFDPDTLSLRRVCYGEIEVLRCVYGAVRDRNWGTILPVASDLQVHTAQSEFSIGFFANCHRDQIEFQWRGEITGCRDGTISFQFDGNAESTFWRNRIGLCALHPLDGCTGRSCRVLHVDGSQEEGRFPDLVAPHQPFKNIRALTHWVPPGVPAEVRFEGEIFEMEDQRNWTDASFKTYSTPLELPFPVQIARGTRVVQEVRLRLLAQGQLSSAITDTADPVITVDQTSCRPLPNIGLCYSSDGPTLTTLESSRLKALALDHLRIDLHPDRQDWFGALQLAAQAAQQAATGLEVALHCSPEAFRELRDSADAIRPLALPVRRWLLYERGRPAISGELAKQVCKWLEPLNPNASFAAGTNANFAELNRNWLPDDCGLAPCFSISPQVHAFDDASLVENLEGQWPAVNTAARVTRERVVVSPITLRPRINPVATSASPQASPGTLPPEVDRRQMSLLGAAWTLGSLAALCRHTEVASLTYYETSGWRGVMERPGRSGDPGLFPSIPGGLFPMYFVFAGLAAFRNVCALTNTQPLSAAALAVCDQQNRLRVLLGNYLNQSQTIRLQVNRQKARFRSLDAANAEAAMRDPESFLKMAGAQVDLVNGEAILHLSAGAICFLDFSG